MLTHISWLIKMVLRYKLTFFWTENRAFLCRICILYSYFENETNRILWLLIIWRNVRGFCLSHFQNRTWRYSNILLNKWKQLYSYAIGNEIYLFKQLTLSRDVSNDVVVAIPKSCFENAMNRIPWSVLVIKF